MGTLKRWTVARRVVVGAVLAGLAVAAGYGFGFAFDHLGQPDPPRTGGLHRVAPVVPTDRTETGVTPANTWDMQ